MYLCGNLTKLQSIISEYSKGIEILSILALADHLKSCHVSSPHIVRLSFASMLFGMVLIMFSNLGSLEANACLNGASEEVFLYFGALFLKTLRTGKKMKDLRDNSYKVWLWYCTSDYL